MASKNAGVPITEPPRFLMVNLLLVSCRTASGSTRPD